MKRQPRNRGYLDFLACFQRALAALAATLERSALVMVRALGCWLLHRQKVTKVQLPYLYLRNLDSAPFGGRIGVRGAGCIGVLTRTAERERGLQFAL